MISEQLAIARRKAVCHVIRDTVEHSTEAKVKDGYFGHLQQDNH